MSNYRKQVERITRKQPLYLLENIHRRKRGDHHLDHILSVSFGFHNKIAAEVIGNIANLRMIPYKDNLTKGAFMEQDSFDIFIYMIENGMIS